MQQFPKRQSNTIYRLKKTLTHISIANNFDIYNIYHYISIYIYIIGKGVYINTNINIRVNTAVVNKVVRSVYIGKCNFRIVFRNYE